MPKRRVLIQYDKCLPDKCSPNDGVCAAVQACTHNVLEQEEAHDSPMVLYVDMCQACGDCRQACPLDAIKIA